MGNRVPKKNKRVAILQRNPARDRLELRGGRHGSGGLLGVQRGERGRAGKNQGKGREAGEFHR